MTETGLKGKRVVIEEKVPAQAVSGLAEFIERYYLAPNRRFIEDYTYSQRQNVNGGTSFDFFWKIRVAKGANRPEESTFSIVRVNLKVGESVLLDFLDFNVTSDDERNACSRVAADIQNVVWEYLDHAKMSSLYFVLGHVDTRKVTAPPDQTAKGAGQGSGAQNRILRRVFAGNTVNLFLIFTAFSFLLFFVIGIYTPIVMVAIQLVALFFTDKIMLRLGTVQPTEDSPNVTVVSVRSNPEVLESLKQKGDRVLSEIKDQLRQVVSASLIQPSDAQGDQRDSQTNNPDHDGFVSFVRSPKSDIREILARHGISSSENDIEIRTKNVYGLVKRAAAKFHLQIPKITIVNSLMSNAAATGISTKRASMMVTAGSIEDLDNDELEAVIGHELGHVKGHDPLILFGLTSFEFLGRFYLWFPLLLYLGFFYFILAFGAIFFIGKFLETRADTQSAAVLGNPSALASALTKIGFRQLYYERYSPQTKIFDWLRFDPHPPVYFRVKRLSELTGKTEKIRHSFLISVRDVVSGFFGALFSR